MEKLTRKEEELMQRFWEQGPLFVRELVALCPDPKPHFNTISTMVRSLEAKGYLKHKAYGATYQYHPVVTAEEYRKGNLQRVVGKYFGDSYLGVVSTLIREEKVSVEELKELIRSIETQEGR